MAHELKKRTFDNFTIWTFDHVDTGILGVNGQPFINMEPYIDLSQAAELHEEAMLGIFSSEHLLPGVLGQTPPKLRDEIGYADFEYHRMFELEKHDPTGEHRRRLEALPSLQSRRSYLHYVMKSPLPWAFTVYLRRASFLRKTAREEKFPEWEPNARHFPRLKEWLKTLPFSDIGRVMFFCTRAGEEVPTHRDHVVAPHKDHCINVWFDAPRPTYVYNCLTDDKIYLPPTRAYFFNNRDYHGVDAEPRFRYTLRIDGTFTDEMQAKLGLRDGYVWTNQSSSANAATR